MDATVFLILLQDGLLNGAIYALLGLALVMVFAVTRIIFIPQGEFVTFGALTLAFIINGRTPGTLWLLLIVGVIVAIKDIYHIVKYTAERKGVRIARSEEHTSELQSRGHRVCRLLLDKKKQVVELTPVSS